MSEQPHELAPHEASQVMLYQKQAASIMPKCQQHPEQQRQEHQTQHTIDQHVPTKQANNPLQQTMASELNTGKMPNNHHIQLGRHSSSPACTKPQMICRDHQADHHQRHHHQHQPDHHRHHIGQCVKSKKMLRSKSIFIEHNHQHQSNFSSRNHRHRRSHCDRSCHEHRHHHQGGQSHGVGHKSSTSPSSASTASDSAFSQSQTTLESESEQSTSCFSRSSKDRLSTDEQSRHKIKPITTINHEDAREPGDNKKDPIHLDIDQDHFQIIWKNLSYRVPEKRFTRLAARLARHKEAFWPQEAREPNIGVDAVTGVTQYDHAQVTVNNSNDMTDDDDRPPMKAPTIGKPRKVIFSNLNGCIESGQLTAILGPSGAGKTTFLKCLTNSIVKGVSGSIDIRGGQTTSHHLKLCIIPQKGEYFIFQNIYHIQSLFSLMIAPHP